MRCQHIHLLIFYTSKQFENSPIKINAIWSTTKWPPAGTLITRTDCLVLMGMLGAEAVCRDVCGDRVGLHSCSPPHRLFPGYRGALPGVREPPQKCGGLPHLDLRCLKMPQRERDLIAVFAHVRGKPHVHRCAAGSS